MAPSRPAAADWSLRGASVVDGSESYKVHGASDSKSLAIAATGTAVSPAVCVDVTARRSASSRTHERHLGQPRRQAALERQQREHERDHRRRTIGTGTSWAASPAMSLSTVLPLWNLDQTASVQLVFDPENYGGSWAIDDVYVDPYGRG